MERGVHGPLLVLLQGENGLSQNLQKNDVCITKQVLEPVHCVVASKLDTLGSTWISLAWQAPREPKKATLATNSQKLRGIITLPTSYDPYTKSHRHRPCTFPSLLHASPERKPSEGKQRIVSQSQGHPRQSDGLAAEAEEAASAAVSAALPKLFAAPSSQTTTSET